MLEKQSPRCKIVGIQKFKDSSHWVIDRWWTREERIKLGFEEASGTVNKIEVENTLSEFKNALEEYEKAKAEITLNVIKRKEVLVGR